MYFRSRLLESPIIFPLVINGAMLFTGGRRDGSWPEIVHPPGGGYGVVSGRARIYNAILVEPPRSLDLIEKIRAGTDKQAAQAELYRRIEAVLLERLRRKIPDGLQSRLDAEDVLQEAFLRAILGLGNFTSKND